ncbi:MAG TPA: VOC family protein [Dehalococcoidia bacterium]|nr:VOC family protein [Dehalococcoidia bacterium]
MTQDATRNDPAPSAYVPSTQQLVVEIYVRDIQRSTAFYRRLGFTPIEDKGSFVALAWDGHQLFLAQQPELPPPGAGVRANVRIMVPDVERCWTLAHEIGARIMAPIGDRDYGIRDFIIADPDGFGIRFGSWLPGAAR